MSQIPRSQFALKKRHNMDVPKPAPMPVVALDHQNGKAAKKNHNANGNGHKNGSFDNDVLIIDDDIFANVQYEEVVASGEETRPQFEDLSPGKKKRSRKSKDSTESRESDVSKKTIDSTSKSPKSAKKTQVEQITTPEPVVEAVVEPKEFKVIKMTDDLAAARSRRSDRLQNASTIVNLSSISTSEQNKMLNDETMDSIQSVPERKVSGRRSTRPIDDIRFEYRSPNADDSLNGTTNATIGSEFNDSLLNTPGTDRKRALSDSSENIDSPKRSRLDMSGLFSSFSSPVALLRNKFKRANIASTPIASGALLNESVETEAEEMKEVDLIEKPEIVADDKEEELQIITTPIKKRSCVVM